MNIDQFETLNSFEKEEVLWEHGIYVLHHVEGLITCDIYQVSDFYVELRYEANKSVRATLSASRICLYQ